MVGDTTDEIDILTHHYFLHDFCAGVVVSPSETALDVLVGDMLPYQLLLAVLAGLHFFLLFKERTTNFSHISRNKRMCPSGDTPF